MAYPEGIGLYIRGLSKKVHGDPKTAAQKAKDHGVSFVAIMAAWQDIKKETGQPYMLHSNGRKPDLIAQYAAAFAEAGIEVWIWGFPRAGGEKEYVERLAHVTDVCDGTIEGWLHDPEVYYKWTIKSSDKDRNTTMRGQPEFAKYAKPIDGSAQHIKNCASKLLALCADEDCSYKYLGFTSYGMAQYHKNYPWKIFGGTGWGSPQLYSVGPDEIDAGIKAWREHGWDHIVPSVPLFGKNSDAKLHAHLSNFVDGNERISGFIFWSWRQASPLEWKVIKRWAEWIRRGACTLPR
jgi:hypothetical protein